MDAAGQNSSLRNETPACMLNSSARSKNNLSLNS